MTEIIIFWSIVIIITGIIELQTSQLTSIWFTLSAIVCLILSFFNINLEIQIVVFFVISIGLLLATRPIVKRYFNNAIIRTNTDKLISMIGIVSVSIMPGEIGEVRVNQEHWRAISANACEIRVGEKVCVNSIVGNKLLVTKINQESDIEII